MATAVKHLGAFDDSLPRALVWGAAWDMTRDAEMAPRDFVELVCENIAVETDSSVVLTVLRQLATTVQVLRPPRAPARGLRRASAPGCSPSPRPPTPAATCSCSW